VKYAGNTTQTARSTLTIATQQDGFGAGFAITAILVSARRAITLTFCAE
jgi:hypothetical protein